MSRLTPHLCEGPARKVQRLNLPEQIPRIEDPKPRTEEAPDPKPESCPVAVPRGSFWFERQGVWQCKGSEKVK